MAEEWVAKQARGYALFHWRPPPSVKHGLELSVGCGLVVTEAYGASWLRGYRVDLTESNMTTSVTKGIFPTAYFCDESLRQSYMPEEPDLVDYVETVCDWAELYRDEYEMGHVSEALRIAEQLNSLLALYGKIHDVSLDRRIREQFKVKGVKKLDQSRLLLGMDMVLKDEEGNPLTHEHASGQELYQMYLKRDRVTAKTDRSEKSDRNNFLRRSAHDLNRSSSWRTTDSLRMSLARGSSGAAGGSGSGASSGVNSADVSPSSSPPASGDTVLSRTSASDHLRSLRSSCNDVTALLTNLSASTSKRTICHIVLHVENVICPVNEPTQLFFSIYGKQSKAFVSEEYMLCLNANGLPDDYDLVGNVNVLFQDIYNREVNQDLFLVCRVVRVGKLLPSDKKKSMDFRRPVAVAALPLSRRELQEDKGVDSTMAVYTTSGKDDECWITIMESIINGKTKDLVPVPNSKGIIITTSLTYSHPSEVQAQMGYATPPCHVQRIGFTDQWNSEDGQRIDMYVTLGVVHMEGSSRKARCLGVTLSLWDVEAHTKVHDVLLYGTGGAPTAELNSMVVLKQGDTRWEESLIIRAPQAQTLHGTALVVEVRKASSAEGKTKVIARGALPLTTENGPMIEDGRHTIHLVTQNVESLLNLPTLFAAATDDTCTSTLTFSTRLCSNKLTTSQSMYMLLHWESLAGQGTPLSAILERFSYVDKMEITKFFNDTWTSLFAMLERSATFAGAWFTEDDAIGLIVDTITATLADLVDERTGSKYRHLLDHYLEHRFSSYTLHLKMIRRLREVCRSADIKTTKKVLMVIKSLQYSLLFMISSWQKAVNMGVESEETFREEANDFLDSLCNLMTDPSLFGPQMVLLKNLAVWLPNLVAFLAHERIATFVVRFMGATGRSDSQFKRNAERMRLWEELMDVDPNAPVAFLTYDAACRALTIPAVLQHAAVSFDSTDDSELNACTALTLHTLHGIHVWDERQWDLCTLLPTLLKAVESVLRQNASDGGGGPLLGSSGTSPSTPRLGSPTSVSRLGSGSDLTSSSAGVSRRNRVTCLIMVLHRTPVDQFVAHVSAHSSDVGYLQRMVGVLRALLDTPTYPPSWFALRMMLLTVVASTLRTLCDVLIQMVEWDAVEVTRLTTTSGTNGDATAAADSAMDGVDDKGDVDADADADATEGDDGGDEDADDDNDSASAALRHLERVVVPLMSCVVDLIMHPKLTLEHMTPKKSALITKQYGDVRPECMCAFERVFRAVGVALIRALPDHGNALVSRVFDVMLCQPLRERAFELFAALMTHDWTTAQDFRRSEAQAMDAMDVMIDHPDFDDFTAFFFPALKASLERMRGCQEGQRHAFASGLRDLLELSNQLRTLPSTPEYEDERTAAMLRLMKFLAKTAKWDTYVKYVHTLADYHMTLGNPVESGLTLMLHADRFQWSETTTLRKLKEKMMLRAADALESGNNFEEAVIIVKQLQHVYQHVYPNFVRLADLFDHEARLVRSIATTDRLPIHYFYVRYVGNGWARTLSNRGFVYKGNPLETLGDFRGRISAKFPNAEMLTYTTVPEADVSDSDRQCLQVFKVNPCSPQEVHGKPRRWDERIPERSRQYIVHNNVCHFFYERPFKKSKDAGNGVDELWTAKTFFRTSESFPHISRRSAVEDMSVVEVSPIETALRFTREKTHDVKQMITRYSAPNRPKDVNPFGQCVQGIVQAFVNGGTKEYEKAFFPPAYAAKYPDQAEYVQQLRDALEEQHVILGEALEVFGGVCPAELDPLRIEMLKTYAILDEQRM